MSADKRGPALNTRIVSFQGVIEQALLDVSAWAEKGVAPPASTNFAWVDGQVHVPVKASERKGIQASVELTANGAVRADVPVGRPVEFCAMVEAPPGTGTIVSADGTSTARANDQSAWPALTVLRFGSRLR